MAQKKSFNPKLISIVAWIVVLSQTIFLIVYYADNRRPDVFHYIDNAELLIKGKNPYLDGTARWGTVGPLFFVPFSRLFNELQIAQIMILSSIISIIVFFRHALNVKKNILPVLVCTTLFLSPVRELFALGQINAVCLGLISFSIKMSNVHSQNRLVNCIKNGFIAGMGAIAIDLKPHIFFVVAFVLYSYHMTRTLFVLSLAMLTCGHLVVDMYRGRFYELDWLRIIYSESDIYLNSESKNFIGLIATVNDSPQSIVKIFSIMVYGCIAICLLLNKEMSGSNKLFMVSSVGFLLPYFHFYDFLIPALIFITRVVTRDVYPKTVEWCLLLLLTIPQNVYSLSGIGSLALIILIVLLARKFLSDAQGGVKAKRILISFMFYLSITVVLNTSVEDNFTYQSILNSLIFIALVTIMWSDLKQSFQVSRVKVSSPTIAAGKENLKSTTKDIA